MTTYNIIITKEGGTIMSDIRLSACQIDSVGNCLVLTLVVYIS